MKKLALSVLGAVLGMNLLLAMAVAAQESSAKKENESKPARAEEKVEVKAASDEAYIIGEDDVLDISVWKEVELTKTLPVRSDGKISLPLVQDVRAAGLTPTQLSMIITEKLRKFLADPQVTVIVREIRSRRIYIVGEVTRAGAYPMLPNMTVLQALSSAGGFNQYANLKGIYVLRAEKDGRQVRFPFNYKEVISGRRPEQNIILKPGDTIVVP